MDYEKLYDRNTRDRLKFARFIDNLDMYIGPFSSALKLSSSEHLSYMGFVLDMGDLAIKGAFAIGYVIESRNFSALLEWVPREIFSSLMPYGGLVDIARSYERVVKEDFENKVNKYMKNKIGADKVYL